MILLVLAILASAGAGAAVEHRWHEQSVLVTDRGIQLLLYGLMPFITFFVIARLDLHAGVGAGLALAWLELLTVGALAWLAATRMLHLDRPTAGTVVVCTILANTGYLGIPLNSTLLGGDAVAPAIAWDVAVSTPMLLTVGFGVAAACGTRAGDTARERTKAFFTRNPPLLALLAAVAAPSSFAPDLLVDLARLAAFTLLPIGFFLLGVHLAREQEEGIVAFPPPLSKPVGVVLILRMLVAPALFTALALTLHRVPDAYRLQAAMPCGINALVAAHTYGLNLRLAASAITWTTALAVAAAALGGILT